MWLSLVGVLIGCVVTIGTAIFVENLRRPKLRLLACKAQFLDYSGEGRPAERMRLVHVKLENKPLPCWARWLSRNPAIQCHGTISFHHLDDGQNIFGRSMPLRWGGTPEPVPMRIDIGDKVLSVYDPYVWMAQRVDIYPDEHAVANVAARFNDEEDCYGWSNESYFSDPLWRDPSWKLEKGRYLVKVAVMSGGETCVGVFRLVNDVGVDDFRLIESQKNDEAND